MAKKKNNATEEPIIGETIPPDVEAPEADEAKHSSDAFFKASMGAYSKLFEQAQGHFTKIADIAQEVFETMIEQGKKVEENLKEKMESSHATERAKEFAHKAEEQAKEFAKRAEEQAKKFKEEYLNDEKVASYRKSFAEAIEPINIFALNKQVDELTAKVASLEAELASLKGGAPNDEAKPAKKTSAKKKDTDA